jgi:hypothetical protein
MRQDIDMNYPPSLEEGFDWEKVHKVMEFLGWTWHESGVPTVEQLKECAIDHVETTEKSEHTTGSYSGGFEAYKFKDENGNDLVGLRFVLEKWEPYH